MRLFWVGLRRLQYVRKGMSPRLELQLRQARTMLRAQSDLCFQDPDHNVAHGADACAYKVLLEAFNDLAVSHTGCESR